MTNAILAGLTIMGLFLAAGVLEMTLDAVLTFHEKGMERVRRYEEREGKR